MILTVHSVSDETENPTPTEVQKPKRQPRRVMVQRVQGPIKSLVKTVPMIKNRVDQHPAVSQFASLLQPKLQLKSTQPMSKAKKRAHELDADEPAELSKIQKLPRIPKITSTSNTIRNTEFG